MAKEHTYRQGLSFPAGIKVIPLYQKCPLCGYDLNQVPESFINKIKTDTTKNGSGKTIASSKSCPKKALAPHLFDLCKAWMVFPFTAAKKYATKRNQQRFVRWKFWK